ncbi:MAG: helix-hairpin-helix domain-containing protein, partial [Bdellovibrionota bacterium]
GIVEIMAAAREPGQRAKIAVRSKDSSVDPVGACVGMKGSRVQNIVQELRGEKIDIVNFEEDATAFVCNGLAPAEISKVFVDEINRSMEVVVPDHQLSLAIGRKGQNVRLAAKLTKWKIDILSESSAAQKSADATFNLMLIPGMTETMAQNIFQSGFSSFQSIAESAVDEVMAIPGYDTEEKARALVDSAQAVIDKYEAEGKPIPAAPKASGEVSVSGAGLTGGSAKSKAEERLKEELSQLKQQEAQETEQKNDKE